MQMCQCHYKGVCVCALVSVSGVWVLEIASPKVASCRPPETLTFPSALMLALDNSSPRGTWAMEADMLSAWLTADTGRGVVDHLKVIM